MSLLLLLLAWAPVVLHGQPITNRTWISFDGSSPTGAPPVMTVLQSAPTSTVVQVRVPGAWLSTESYAGRTFTKVELPPVARLAGVGFPDTTRSPWYEFPAGTRHPPLSASEYVDALAVTVPKPVFPKAALGQKPRTGAEMAALGINPAGGRPGIPAVRGFMAASRRNLARDTAMIMQKQEGRTLTLANPLLPAGFEGADQAAPPGYAAPALIDEEFYNTFQGVYRGTETNLTEVSGLGAFSGVEVRAPLLEVLTPQRIRFLTNLVFEVKHLRGLEDFDCPISWDSWIFKIPFINGKALRDRLTTKGIEIQASRSAHYLILTPRSFRTTLNEFALWKQAKGLNVDFAYVGSALGDDVPADRVAIDKFIEEYFHRNYCHGVYVLLVGDIELIPAGRSSRVTLDPDESDADSDHVYEVLGSDRFASLYVGRLPVNNATELKNQLNKILSYERSPAPGDWPRQVTLAANGQNDDGSVGVSPEFPSKYAAAVNAIAAYGGYDSPPSFEVLHAGAASSAVTRAVNQDVLDAVQDGRGQVLYRGHGDGHGWVYGWDGSGTGSGEDFTDWDHISKLTNKVYPIVYSIACQNSRIRLTDCIGEEWLKRVGGGAVAHWGASVNSYTAENHNRAKGIFRAIYECGYTRLAPALARAECISWCLTGDAETWDNNTFAYLLLGDPELTIRRAALSRTPLVFEITNYLNGIVILVQGPLGQPEPGVLVNIAMADGSSVNGFTGLDGRLFLSNIDPEQIAQLDLHSEGAASSSQSWPFCMPPRITRHPVSAARNPCMTNCITLSVSATGTGPLRYQWYHDGLAIPAATSTSYIICPVTPDKAGDYYARVSNPCGSVNSAIATIIVETNRCLLVNPSFELVTPPLTPPGGAPFQGVPGWSAPIGSPDLFRSPAAVPVNLFGSQAAFHGTNYAGISNGTIAGVFGGDVLQGAFISPMITGSCYRVTARFSLAEAFAATSFQVDVVLSDGSPAHDTTIGTMTVIDKVRWVPFSRFVTASHPFDRIQFRPRATGPLPSRSYLYIDYVGVCCCKRIFIKQGPFLGGTNFLSVTFPSFGVLQQTDRLGPNAAWREVSTPPGDGEADQTVLVPVPAGSGRQFFRLLETDAGPTAPVSFDPAAPGDCCGNP